MSDSNSVDSSNQLLQAKAVLLSVLLSGALISIFTLYNRHLRQFTSPHEIPHGVFKKGYLFGKVTSVGDGDNFHFFHMPGGLLGGWYWLRNVPSLRRTQTKDIKGPKFGLFSLPLALAKFLGISVKKNKYMELHVPYLGRRSLPTISVRLCGVDAPERAHFGKSAQPYSEEALLWLRYKLLGKFVWIKPLAIDQYGRCISKVKYCTWTGSKNVSLEMIKQGIGVVYEGKVGAEFDGDENLFKYHELVAKKAKLGVWGLRKFESPGSHKRKQ